MPPRIACFLAHLAAEKALKAGLIVHGVPFKKTHDLIDLGRALADIGSAGLEESDLKQLNPWVIEGRYAEDLPDAPRTPAIDLVEASADVLATVERLLSKEGRS